MSVIKHLKKIGFNKFLWDFGKAKVNNAKFIIIVVVVAQKTYYFWINFVGRKSGNEWKFISIHFNSFNQS